LKCWATLSPFESVSADSSNVTPNSAFTQPAAEFAEPAEVFLADEAEPAEAEEAAPNGFVLLGLAPELIQRRGRSGLHPADHGPVADHPQGFA
jgi:hypothetical protein